MPGYNYLTIASGYAKHAKLFIVNSDVAKRETYLMHSQSMGVLQEYTLGSETIQLAK